MQKVYKLALSLIFLGYNKENIKNIMFELRKDVINAKATFFIVKIKFDECSGKTMNDK